MGKRVRIIEKDDGCCQRVLGLRHEKGRLANDAKERVVLRNTDVPGLVDASV